MNKNQKLLVIKDQLAKSKEEWDQARMEYFSFSKSVRIDPGQGGGFGGGHDAREDIRDHIDLLYRTQSILFNEYQSLKIELESVLNNRFRQNIKLISLIVTIVGTVIGVIAKYF